MKITHYLKGDITPKKRGSNQYKTKKKSNIKNWLTITGSLFAIGAIIVGYNAYQADASIFTRVFMGKEPIVEVQSELTAEQEAKIEANHQLDLREAKAENKRVAAEKDLEQIRKERLSLK